MCEGVRVCVRGGGVCVCVREEGGGRGRGFLNPVAKLTNVDITRKTLAVMFPALVAMFCRSHIHYYTQLTYM